VSKKKVSSDKLVTIPFDDLLLYHGEIGEHRGRKYGMGEVFGYRSLRDLPFAKLAKKVKEAYEGKKVPDHKGWPAQREAIRWLVEKGPEALYQFKDDIRARRGHGRNYYVVGGNHRALALYILGAQSIRAAVER
jgi:hypothetical protein